MAALNVEPNIIAPDDFYEALIEAHRGLTDAQSELLNARLVLLLANHIGDRDVLDAALHAARDGIEAPPPTQRSDTRPKASRSALK